MTNEISIGGVRYKVTGDPNTSPAVWWATSAEADRLCKLHDFAERWDEEVVRPVGPLDWVTYPPLPDEPRIIVMPEGVVDPRDDCHWGPSLLTALWDEQCRTHTVSEVMVPPAVPGTNWHHDPGFSTGPIQNSWGVDNWEHSPPTRPLADLQAMSERLREHGQPLQDYIEYTNQLRREVIETLRVEFGDSYEGDVAGPAEEDPKAKPTNTEELREWLRAEGAEDRPQHFTSEGGYFSDN